MAGSVNMENLLLSFKGKFENLNFAGIYNIKPIPFISFLENELTLFKGQFKGYCLYCFQLGA